MQRRYGTIEESAPRISESRKAYDKLYGGKLPAKEFAAVRELFPATKAGKTPRGRHLVSAMA